jgi:hypothetical protein
VSSSHVKAAQRFSNVKNTWRTNPSLPILPKSTHHADRFSSSALRKRLRSPVLDAARAKSLKLITIYGRDWSKRLCNGCYGRLLSLYEIKAGTAPEDQRAEELAAALLSGVTAERQREAQRIFQASGKRAEYLSPSATRFVTTAEDVERYLPGGPHLEWSPAVIGLCKAVDTHIRAGSNTAHSRLKDMGFDVGTIHGGMQIGSREQPATRLFAEQQFKEGAVQILVATEAAGEGINLQFCHMLVNYDIPWNPNLSLNSVRISSRWSRSAKNPSSKRQKSIHEFFQALDPSIKRYA